jgi:hypothetical protein
MYCGLHFQFRPAHYHSCNTLNFEANVLVFEKHPTLFQEFLSPSFALS